MKRLWIRVRPEHVEAVQEATLQPGALARLRKQALAEVKAEISSGLGAQLKNVSGQAVPPSVLAAIEGDVAARAAFGPWLAEPVHAVADGGGDDAVATEEGGER